jgi:hypothetical protein
LSASSVNALLTTGPLASTNAMTPPPPLATLARRSIDDFGRSARERRDEESCGSDVDIHVIDTP